MIDFLIEIGFEEFPPSFLPVSAHELTAKIEALLKKEKIFYRTIRTIYTARRMGAIVLGLTRKQKPQVIEVQGPPARIAYDKEGKPTEMLAGFMKSHDLKPGDVKTVKTAKGEYIVGTKHVAGKTTEEILGSELPQIIRSLEFSKTMVWNDSGDRFPRPVRWIVALLDRKPIKFKIAGIQSDRYSIPNFHFSFNPIRLEKPREYLTSLRHGGVVADPNERKKIIQKQINDLAAKLKGEPLFDAAMIEEINCTIEYPDVVSGEFEERYLELPPEVLFTTLKALGNLVWIKDTNKFICVFSAKRRAADNIGAGYGKVLRSRLYDAHFYYQNDLKLTIDAMLKHSQSMLWLKDFGSIADKAKRLARFTATFEAPGIDPDALKQAAEFCKADLLSNMVREKEFTSLQGIMGGYYAQAAGKGDKAALAIKEHYLPRFIGDDLPSTIEGVILSIADKIDNVAAAFHTGQKPSSSFDPFGIRRNGYAVVNMIDANALNISIKDAIKKYVGLLPSPLENVAVAPIIEFFDERIDRYLEDLGFRYDEIKSVLPASKGNAYDARRRCEALKNYRDKPEFEQLVIGQKRVRNILKGKPKQDSVNPELLQEKAEKKLYEQGQEISGAIQPLIEKQEYATVLDRLLSMRPDIDKFFDDVLVMCEDMNLQKNRLALVSFINQLFIQFADLSQIVIGTEDKKGK
ncbi:MAG TPA: glycine--tRNA ligase subunit beta [bacterium]